MGGYTFLMDNVVNLNEYRKAKEDAEIDEEIAYLRSVIEEIVASLPPMEDGSYGIPLSEQLEPFLSPQTNLDGYETDE
jgi:hypothetical protein